MMPNVKKPEWGVAIEFPGGQLPALVYDRHGLPCAFALFTSKANADTFLNFKKAAKGQSFKLGAEYKITMYQAWALKCVQGMLHELGKELAPQEVAGIIFTQMPIFVDVKSPHLASCGQPAYPDFMALIREHFTSELLLEHVQDALFQGFRNIQYGGKTFTVAMYAGDWIDKVFGGKYFGLCMQGSVESIESFFDPSLRIGETICLTSICDSEEKVLESAMDWIKERPHDLA